MSDNSKKYLWIAAAVTAFVLVVAAASLLLFRPSPVADKTPFDTNGTAEAKQTQATDYSAQASGTPAPGAETTAQTTEGGKSGDVYIVYGDKGQTTTTVVTTQAAPPVQPKPTPTTLSVAPVTTTTVKPAPIAPVTAAKTVQPKPTASATPEPAAPAPAKTAAKAPAKPQAASSGYWIQTGSFSKQASANANRDYLSAQHFPAEIKTIGGSYKVRVGPYASRAEAANMLSSVKLLKGCEAAWITQ
jgi:cell division protein FtsN